MLRRRITFSKDELRIIYIQRTRSAKDANYTLMERVMNGSKKHLAEFTETLKQKHGRLYSTILPEFPPRNGKTDIS